ncbi:AraC family transcriptional regulator [Pokkaliibacter plantistimulans]|uniref:AraC family transcriptional regulator n=1 Tax=Proteobacteria bacterium 228 TaxID=2083153 RepID=A0A2S5KTS0_9PROT|nr:helix-turn-helix domain-containing protein [Pokkaliibacter plantistimulans]PPC77666.1 AraC family transcriptional regulator [Pokkaliibacter plantistimulans]
MSMEDWLRNVPSYALYGEEIDEIIPERMHCESIAERSELYEWEIRPHRHEVFFQILYVEQGQGVALVDQQRFDLTGPCALWIPPLLTHGFQFSQGIRGYVLTIEDGLLPSLLGESLLQSTLAYPQRLLFAVDEAEYQHFHQVMAAILLEYKHSSWGRLQALHANLSLLLVHLGRALMQQQDTLTVTQDNRAGRHVRKYLALVDRHYRQHRPVQFYAERLGITPTQLNRVCQQVLGKTALTVIHQRLLLEGKRDLLYANLSINEVAQSLGFADQAYFSRFFTRHSGATPSEFRQQARQQLVSGRATPLQRNADIV